MDYFRTTTINIEPIDLGPPYFAPERFKELPHTPYPTETSWLRSVLDLESLDSDDSGDDGSDDSDSDNDGSEDSSSETDDSDESDSGGEDCDNEVSDEEFFDDEVLDDEINDNDDVSDGNLKNEGGIRSEECETDCEGPEMYLGEIVTDVMSEVAQSNDEENHVEGYRYADCWAREIDDGFLNSDSGRFDSLSAEDLEKVMGYLS